MPALVLKSIPESLHRRLKAAAASHRRSLTQEAIILLDQALSSPRVDDPTPYFARRSLLPEFAALEKSGALAARPHDQDVTELISEQRE
jgi:plasmid stability protein